jgi:hypothetical protein
MIQGHEQEMSISHQEFYRLLPFALRDVDYDISNNQINASYGDGNIQIKPGLEHERKIASLVLPVLHVEFIFTDITPVDITQFLDIFNRAYHRGGG